MAPRKTTKTEEAAVEEEAPATEPAAAVSGDTVLDALEREKGGYKARGLTDRAKEVDAAIAARKKSGGAETAVG